MKVLAKKHKLIGLIYLVAGILGIFLIYSGYGETNNKLLFTGIVVLLISIITVMRFIKTPGEPILLNPNNELVLPDGTFSFDQVLDISYKRASAKGVQYKWGKIIIKTAEKEYVYNYIANCEQVAKDITKLKYENQSLQVS